HCIQNELLARRQLAGVGSGGRLRVLFGRLGGRAGGRGLSHRARDKAQPQNYRQPWTACHSSLLPLHPCSPTYGKTSEASILTQVADCCEARNSATISAAAFRASSPRSGGKEIAPTRACPPPP